MPELKLEFRIRLTGPSPREAMGENGPLFHRWLPDGKNDAIALTQASEPEQITVWFERQMRNNHGFLHWKPGGSAFDLSIMRRQYKLGAGPLFGMMSAVVSKAELEAIEEFPIRMDEEFGTHDPESKDYINAGKRIAGKIQQRVQRLVSRLRTQYGQYWLEDMLPWDSRGMSLGTYCSSVLSLRWWREIDSCWCRFLPTPGQAVVTSPKMPGRGYAEYLTESDWRALQAHGCQSDVGLCFELMGTATKALDTDNSSYAFITVITAFEVALAARLQVGKGHQKVLAALNSFDNRETLPARAAVVLLACGVTVDDVETVLSAIHVRNRIAHEGYRPSDRESSELRSVMQTIRFLMQVEELKIPILTNANDLAAP